MKKLLLALGLLCPVPVFAALPSDTTWEVRTTGSDNNGGCFDTGGAGTDYSQQDAAQLSLTDLAQTLSSTTLTSATGGFTSAMVDNCIQITGAGTGAFTLGFYEITVFTDTNTVTIDRTACSTANCSGGTGAVGGALAGGDLGNKPAEAGTHTIYIKAGTYTSSITSGAGSNWYGYNASRGDHPTGTDRPLIDCASTRVNGITTDGQTQVFRNLRVANCTGDGILETGNNYFWNVKSSSNSSSGFEHKYANNQGIMCFLCEAASNSNNGFDYGSSTGNYYHIYAGYTHDNGLRGLEGASGGHIFIWSVAETNASHGVENPGHVVNSVSHGNTGVGSDGYTSITSGGIIFNSAATSNADYGFSASALSSARRFDYNGYNGNTTGGLLNITAGPRDVTGAPNFTAPSSGDFTINASSALLATGFPQDGAEIGLTGDYQANIGVDQDDNTPTAPFQPVGGPTIIIR